MVEAMDKVLSQIEAQHGSIDEFVKTELGYDTIAETYQALAAEQMDSVAMAIYQMKQEQALIIGDQTGVGKGRQMAALIRWAVQRGEKPVFITQKADLFSDIYRDLVDVGSGDLVPFIFNSDGAMVDSKGNTVHKPLSSAEMAKVFASGALPEEYDFAVLTYSQVNTGDAVSQQEMEEAAKKSGARTKKSKNVKNGKATPKPHSYVPLQRITICSLMKVIRRQVRAIQVPICKVFFVERNRHICKCYVRKASRHNAFVCNSYSDEPSKG